MRYAARAGLALLLVASAGAARAQTAEFAACVEKLRAEALGKGIGAETLNTALTGVEFDQSVVDSMERQPEFTTPIWDYLAGLVDAQRIADGQERLAQWARVLAEAEQRFGVDRHTLVAIWGVESDYGRLLGARPLVRSLTTASCFGHRQRFFRNELLATLRILQSGDIAAESLVGSWAGAFGQTQFMPTTFQRLAIDFDGDGRRDIVGSVPDALGSTANYLARAGWVSGQPWGYEVRLPAQYAGASGRRSRQPLERWSRAGIRRIDGSALTGPSPAALLLPAGARGPAFIVFKNFDVIYAYNAAESYSLAIAHLSDRLQGSGPFETPWPTDDPGLSRAERREVQTFLIARGFDIGKADGMIGSRTRAAIEAFQTAAGLPADGRAGMRMLQALKAAAPRPTAALEAPADASSGPQTPASADQAGEPTR